MALNDSLDYWRTLTFGCELRMAWMSQFALMDLRFSLSQHLQYFFISSKDYWWLESSSIDSDPRTGNKPLTGGRDFGVERPEINIHRAGELISTEDLENHQWDDKTLPKGGWNGCMLMEQAILDWIFADYPIQVQDFVHQPYVQTLANTDRLKFMCHSASLRVSSSTIT